VWPKSSLLNFIFPPSVSAANYAQVEHIPFQFKYHIRTFCKMALAPKFAGQKFTATNAPTLHTLELYLDYVCPYSAKMFNTVYTSVFPLIKQKYASKVQIIFRQQIQPWHPSSTLVQ
jgi:hypothetical protein